VKNPFAIPPLLDYFSVAHASAPAPSPEPTHFTAGQRIVFRPGDERAAELLSATPARELVVGAFALALADLDDDGAPELIVQRVTLPGMDVGRSTMVLKKRKDRYVKLLDCKLRDTLAVTNEKIGRFHALAELDASGSIRSEASDQDGGAPKQVVRPIVKKPPKPVQ